MLEPVPSAEDPMLDPTESSHRLRLVSCTLSRLTGGLSSVAVEFSMGDSGHLITSRMNGTASPTGDLRLAALATLDAVSAATGKLFTAELIGAKPIRAFDTTLMVVAILARCEGVSQRLVGAAIADDDQLTSVAIATLQAVNRVVSPLITLPSAPH